jgi:hypothetical protein
LIVRNIGDQGQKTRLDYRPAEEQSKWQLGAADCRKHCYRFCGNITQLACAAHPPSLSRRQQTAMDFGATIRDDVLRFSKASVALLVRP